MTTPEFIRYLGSPDLHDGSLVDVRHNGPNLEVEVKGYTGTLYRIKFSGVESTTSHKPVGMVLYSLSELRALPPLRHFVFVNSYEPTEEGGDSRLEVTAQNVSFEQV
jgi:hypothetical protein